jgi:hypothetical protein
MSIAGQLPENTADAKLVMVALQDLLDNFMGQSPGVEMPRGDNVLPFGTTASSG